MKNFKILANKIISVVFCVSLVLSVASVNGFAAVPKRKKLKPEITKQFTNEFANCNVNAVSPSGSGGIYVLSPLAQSNFTAGETFNVRLFSRAAFKNSAFPDSLSVVAVNNVTGATISLGNALRTTKRGNNWQLSNASFSGLAGNYSIKAQYGSPVVNTPPVAVNFVERIYDTIGGLNGEAWKYGFGALGVSYYYDTVSALGFNFCQNYKANLPAPKTVRRIEALVGAFQSGTCTEVPLTSITEAKFRIWNGTTSATNYLSNQFNGSIANYELGAFNYGNTTTEVFETASGCKYYLVGWDNLNIPVPSGINIESSIQIRGTTTLDVNMSATTDFVGNGGTAPLMTCSAKSPTGSGINNFFNRVPAAIRILVN